MVADMTKSLVRDMVEQCEATGDLTLVERFFAADFVDHRPLPGVPPNRDGMKGLFAALKTAFPDLEIVVEDQIAEEHSVATRKTFRGTHRGVFLGVPPTGKCIQFEVIDILRVRNQQITDHWVVVDRFGLLQQLGVLPADA